MDKNWKRFWLALIIVACVWEFSTWYGDNYCRDVAIPVKCSK